jgi:hypothetical protein
MKLHISKELLTGAVRNQIGIRTSEKMKMKAIQYFLIIAVVVMPFQGRGAAWFNRAQQIASIGIQRSRPTVKIQELMLKRLPTLTAGSQPQKLLPFYPSLPQQLAPFNTAWHNSYKEYRSHHAEQSWWQRWRSKFSGYTPKNALGFSLFGWHLWWSDSDICQTAEDILDSEKINKTIEYYEACTDESKKKLITQFVLDNFGQLSSYQNGIELLSRIMKCDAYVVPSYAQHVVDHADNLIAHMQGIKLISKVLRNNPETIVGFTQAAAKNFATLMESPEGEECLAEIRGYNSQADDIFLQPTIDNFTHLVQNKKGILAIHSAVCNNSQAFNACIPLIADNFTILIRDYYGKQVITKILCAYPESADAFIRPLIINFDILAADNEGRNLIYRIANNNHQVVETCVQPIAANFSEFIVDEEGRRFIQKIIYQYDDVLRACSQPIIDCFSALISTETGRSIIRGMLEKNPSASRAFSQLVVDNFTNLISAGDDYGIISLTIQNNPSAAETFMQPVLDHFRALVSCQKAARLVVDVVQHFSPAASIFTQPILKNFNDFIKNIYSINALKAIIKNNPKAAGLFAQPIIDNFTDIIRSREGVALILELINQNTEVIDGLAGAVFNNYLTLADRVESDSAHNNSPKKELIAVIIKHNPQAAVVHFSTLITREDGLSGILQLIDTDTEAAMQFVQPILDHVAALLKSNSGSRLIKKVIMHNPQACIEGFSALIAEPKGLDLIAEMIRRNPQVASALDESVLNNFSALLETANGINVIRAVIEQKPKADEAIIFKILENFNLLIESVHGRCLIKEMIACCPSSAQNLAQPVIDHFPTLITCGYGMYIIKELMKQVKLPLNKLMEIVSENFPRLSRDWWGRDFIREISISHPEALERFKDLANKHHDFALQKFIDQFLLIKTIVEQFEVTGATQSTKHFKALIVRNCEKIIDYFPGDEKVFNRICSMISTIITTEEDEQAQGKYTFVHAYSWRVRFLQDIDAHLRSTIYDTPRHPLSLRFSKQPNLQSGDKHLSTRKELIGNGVKRYYAIEENKQKYMIFMNYALLANQMGSNTLQYIAHNRCNHPPDIMLDKIFKHLDLEDYLSKYRIELEELQALHQQASIFGAGVLFSFTPQMLKESVYICDAGGPKRRASIEGIGETDDVKLILDTLRTTPEKIHDLDDLEFVFVVTKDCGLNPHVIEAGGVKTIPFNAADPDKLALYESKRDELMAKIAADVQTQRNAWNEQQRQEHARTSQQRDKWNRKFNCLNDCGSRLQEA